jgi:ATP-dependent DNA ligase
MGEDDTDAVRQHSSEMQVRLGYQEGTSDKVYELDLVRGGELGKIPTEGKWTVKKRWGRRGNKLQEAAAVFPTRKAALASLEKTAKAKRDKGYTDLGPGFISKRKASKAKPRVVSKNVMNAKKWGPAEKEMKRDPTGYWASEKYDGLRGVWNGTEFISKGGNAFHAPEWFTEGLPRHISLDGELWGGRDTQQTIQGIVRRTASSSKYDEDDWRNVQFVVFDSPSMYGDISARYGDVPASRARRIIYDWIVTQQERATMPPGAFKDQLQTSRKHADELKNHADPVVAAAEYVYALDDSHILSIYQDAQQPWVATEGVRSDALKERMFDPHRKDEAVGVEFEDVHEQLRIMFSPRYPGEEMVAAFPYRNFDERAAAQKKGGRLGKHGWTKKTLIAHIEALNTEARGIDPETGEDELPIWEHQPQDWFALEQNRTSGGNPIANYKLVENWRRWFENDDRDFEERRHLTHHVAGVLRASTGRVTTAARAATFADGHPRWALAPQWRVGSAEELIEQRDQIIEAGGEGLMIRDPTQPWESFADPKKRSWHILKVKAYHDEEGKVVGYEEGLGKNEGRVGALIVERMDGSGKTFKIGTGLTDHDRDNPPPVGSVIEYRFLGKTHSGTPKHASFNRIRKELMDRRLSEARARIRNINNQQFVRVGQPTTRQYSRRVAGAVRSRLGRNARVIPSSYGYNVWIGPPRGARWPPR